MSLTNYIQFNYNKNINSLPDELIYDITNLLKIIIKEIYHYNNDFNTLFIPIDKDYNEYVYKLQENKDNTNIPPFLIEQLNRNCIKIHLYYNNKFDLNINFKDNIIYLEEDTSDKNISIDQHINLIMLILILCIYYNIIENNILINIINIYTGDYYYYKANEIIDEEVFKIFFSYLKKLDYSSFKYKINNNNYSFSLTKDKTMNIPKNHTIDEYFV